MARLEWNGAKIERQVAFGTARALTQVAQAAAATVKRELPQTFDRPTPFTLNAVGVVAATRQNLVSTVFIKDAQAKYLELEETGGTRTPKPGAPVNTPVDARLNNYGNLPRRAIKRYIAQKRTFVADGEGRTSHLKPGVYRRADRGERRKGGKGTKGALPHGGEGKAVGGSAAKGATSLELLVAFRPAATYRPRFGFRKQVIDDATRRLPEAIRSSVAQALATAR